MVPSIIVSDWKPLERNSLRGFCTVRFPSGMIVADVTLHRSSGKLWASPPSKPMLDRDGVVMRDAETGKIRYSPIITFASKEIRDRWSAQVVEAVRRAHPEAVG